jgi:hypothetical protein
MSTARIASAATAPINRLRFIHGAHTAGADPRGAQRATRRHGFVDMEGNAPDPWNVAVFCECRASESSEEAVMLAS